MKILILEPYMTGSHKAWANEYAERSGHDVEVLGLAGAHWKWRMHGGAFTLARLFLAGGFKPDLILASDMLDLTAFLALTRTQTSHVKTAVYFHENQLTYPWSENDPDPAHQRDAHYAFINVASALAADAVLFNSRYHMEAFNGALKPFLEAFPDHNELGSGTRIRDKSRVLHLGLDLEGFDPFGSGCSRNGPPLILWNHRWEYDKNPEEFFRAIFVLLDEGLEFQVAVLGERFSEVPPVFSAAAGRLAGRIVSFGYVGSFDEYAGWLCRADILPVTSIHDFFGASVVQAIYCNCYPLLPRRLAYPEHIPPESHGDFLYEGFEDLLARLRKCVTNIDETRRCETCTFVERYDWATMAPHYDDLFEEVCAAR